MPKGKWLTFLNILRLLVPESKSNLVTQKLNLRLFKLKINNLNSWRKKMIKRRLNYQKSLTSLADKKSKFATNGTKESVSLNSK